MRFVRMPNGFQLSFACSSSGFMMTTPRCANSNSSWSCSFARMNVFNGRDVSCTVFCRPCSVFAVFAFMRKIVLKLVPVVSTNRLVNKIDGDAGPL
jgi:hypothetical protein